MRNGDCRGRSLAGVGLPRRVNHRTHEVVELSAASSFTERIGGCIIRSSDRASACARSSATGCRLATGCCPAGSVSVPPLRARECRFLEWCWLLARCWVAYRGGRGDWARATARDRQEPASSSAGEGCRPAETSAGLSRASLRRLPDAYGGSPSNPSSGEGLLALMYR